MTGAEDEKDGDGNNKDEDDGHGSMEGALSSPAAMPHGAHVTYSGINGQAVEGEQSTTARPADRLTAANLEKQKEEVQEDEAWQDMPALASFDIYDDDGKLVAREAPADFDSNEIPYLGGAGKGYTRVQIDEDAQSATSMDDNTAYLFKHGNPNGDEDDEETRDVLAQMQTTKELLTEGQKIAYAGVTRLAMLQMINELCALERTKGSKKEIETATEAMKTWSVKVIARLYSHLEIDSAEQVMIEQLAEHGVQPSDLVEPLMQNARVKNPNAEPVSSRPSSIISSRPGLPSQDSRSSTHSSDPSNTPALPAYEDHEGEDLPEVRTPSQLPKTKNLDIDLRWTVLCDLFLILVADSVYDSRSRQLLERVGSFMDVPWLDICRFEKRVTDSLEMQEAVDKENWDEKEHMENRKKRGLKRRFVLMGLATVGGGLVIGLSAGLLAPVIGAGLAAGFTTIGVAGTSGFLAGAGGAAIITTTGVVSGGVVAVRASNRRTGAVKTFEYRPLHNNKRVNLIVTVAGWMTGKVDDVRLPYSTVDPIMGDIYSVLWEPEMLRSMGETINILATEALTQGLQQILGSTILVALMASLQLPIVLTKLSYLIDNPWTVSLARADLAGLILADSLIDRHLGVRPVTLVGFSLGSRLIFSCLKELAKRGAYGLVQNVYLFGSPIVAKMDEYLKARSVVPGRFVNGYATNDWILGYLFRATSGGIMRVAGLAEVSIPSIENINVTSLVPGHMAYRAAMPRLLRECGWSVESDEFAEIEDPDPDNHEQRQRELINEIEEARKELSKKPNKRKWGLFKRRRLEKKEWEKYEEEPAKADSAGGVIFDVDALRKEAIELATHGIELRQLESTMPTMKLHSSPLSKIVSNGSPTISEPAEKITPKELKSTMPPIKLNSLGTPTRVSIGATSPTMAVASDESLTSVRPVAKTASTTPYSEQLGSRQSQDYGSTFDTPIRHELHGYSPWADTDEDYYHEGEVKMTFE